MLDLKSLIEKGLASTKSTRVVLAAPFEIPELLASEYVRSGRIIGIINEPGNPEEAAEIPVFGQWTSTDHSCLTLKACSRATILFIGAEDQIGGRILYEAVRQRVRQIIFLRRDSCFECRNPLLWLRSLAIPMLLRRVRSRFLTRLNEQALKRVGISFEDGYRDLLERAAFLRLPANTFDPRYAMLIAGSLGPGGAERQLAYSARGIARSGQFRLAVAVENLTPPLNNFHEQSVWHSGGKVHVVPLSAGRYSDPRLIELLAYFRDQYGVIGFHHVVEGILDYSLFLREHRPGLLHTWMDSCNVRAGLAAILVGVPQLILSGRSVAPDHFKIFQPYMRAGYEAIINAAKPVILNNSRCGASDYARWLRVDPKRIEVIHNGFEFPENPHSLRKRARAELGLEENQIVLGGMLRFSEEKRPDLWLQVAERFVQTSRFNRAIAFGDGPMRQELIAQIQKRGLAGRVSMPGITHHSWASYSAFDVFLLTSRMEGLPNVLIEAQAAGVPVVAPDVGGVAETMLDKKTGLLASNDSPEILAELCIELGADQMLRSELGKAAVRFVRDEFSAKKMIERTLRVYSRNVEELENAVT